MKLFLFFDFDGTLTPMTSSPDSAVLAPETKELLKKLSCRPGVKIAIVSGRSLRDLKKKVGVPGLVYAGSHGFDIEGCGIRYSVPIRKPTKTILDTIDRKLRVLTAGIRGVLVEHKGAGVTFHYRMVQPSKVPAVKRAFLKFIRPYTQPGKVRLHTGKDVFEITAPVNWHKGMAVRYILAKHRYKDVLPVYFGDDLNDLAAFKELEGSGLTVFVGKKRKLPAQFYLRDPKDVVTLLKTVDKIAL